MQHATSEVESTSHSNKNTEHFINNRPKDYELFFSQDVKNFIPKSHYSVDPAHNMKNIMKRVGYSVQESTGIARKFTFDSLDTMIGEKDNWIANHVK